MFPKTGLELWRELLSEYDPMVYSWEKTLNKTGFEKPLVRTPTNVLGEQRRAGRDQEYEVDRTACLPGMGLLLAPGAAEPRIMRLNFPLGFLCFRITLHVLFHSDLPFCHTPLHHASYFIVHYLSLYAYLSFLPPSLGVRVSDFWKGRSGHVARWPNSSGDIPLQLREQESKVFSCHPRALLTLPASVTTLSHHAQYLFCPLTELLTIPWYSKHSWSFGIFPFPLPPSILLFSIKSHFSFNSQPHYQLVRSFHLESVPIRTVLPPHFVDSTGNFKSQRGMMVYRDWNW